MRSRPSPVKMVKPIKVNGSRKADELGVHKSLVIKTEAQLGAANTAVLREADAAMGNELASCDLAGGSLNKVPELPPLFVGDPALEITVSSGAAQVLSDLGVAKGHGGVPPQR
jgi:hypothetical protein